MRTRSLVYPGLILSLSWFGAGCGGGDDDDDDDDVVADAAVDAGPDAPIDAAVDPLAPVTLEQSGLWSDFENEVLADGVYAFEPSYILWSDGATKRRWIYLPPDSQIDTSDMNYWVYPVGTKLWKEFTRDDVRVETRLLFKTAEDTWYRIAYKWNEEGTATEAVPSIGEENAVGTEHDIPSRLDCDKCHNRMPDRILGFTALQLDHPIEDPETSMNLDRLVDEGWLTAPPSPQVKGGDTYFTIPGDGLPGNPTQASLGYLHANCGGCHHPQSDVFGTVDMVLKLDVGALANPAVTIEETTIYDTAVNVQAQLPFNGIETRILAGSPEDSTVYARIGDTGAFRMPPVGTEVVDEDALDTLSTWITSLGK